jgi:UDPglucose 6-dehydrogenase
VKAQIEGIFPYLRDETVVLVSSQMPVGSIRDLEAAFAASATGRTVHFACSPENLRLGKAIEIFENPGRIIIGTRGPEARARLEPMLLQICETLMWMGTESAEMTKHALNAFLATCVVFINEVASVCEDVGAEAADVERAIRSDPRVGTKTYVTPGAAFAGGTLARDVTFLNEIAAAHQLRVPMLGGVIDSNATHRGWAFRRLQHLLGSVEGRTVTLWGLSYKPGTDAIRRSVSIELIRLLLAAGARIQAFDPAVKSLPAEFAGVTLSQSPQAALDGADALVVATEWPEFRAVSSGEVTARMQRALVLDQSRFLSSTLGSVDGVEYFKVGSAA